MSMTLILVIVVLSLMACGMSAYFYRAGFEEGYDVGWRHCYEFLIDDSNVSYDFGLITESGDIDFNSYLNIQEEDI